MLFAEPLAQIDEFASARAKGPIRAGKPVTLTFTGGTLDFHRCVRAKEIYHSTANVSRRRTPPAPQFSTRFDSRKREYNFCYVKRRESYEPGTERRVRGDPAGARGG